MEKSIVRGLYVLSAAVLAAAILLVWGVTRSGGSAADKDFRQEKVEEITDMVLQRQPVPEDYFRYLEEDLAAAVAGYNQATDQLKDAYADYAKDLFRGLFYEMFDDGNEDPGFYQRPDLYYQAVDRLSTLALYENAFELFCSDPALCSILAGERGGSPGLWAEGDNIHEAWYVGDDLAQQAAAYFPLVEDLLSQLETAIHS